MPKINDLFNVAADRDAMMASIEDHTFSYRSKPFVKYMAKNFAQGVFNGVAIGVISVGVLVTVVTIANVISPTEEESE